MRRPNRERPLHQIDHVFLFLLSTCYCLYGDTHFPFIRSAFSPIGFLARKRFLTRSATSCTSATFCTSATVRHSAILTATLHSALCQSAMHTFLLEPHASASWLRGCECLTTHSCRYLVPHSGIPTSCLGITVEGVCWSNSDLYTRSSGRCTHVMYPYPHVLSNCTVEYGRT